MRQLEICIPTFNRLELTKKSFAQVYDDDRVAAISITDDCSTDNSYAELKEWAKDQPKIKLYRNENNLDCYACKHQSVVNATNDWVIIFDSDNILSPHYIDTIFAIPEWDKHTLYQPEFSRPYFDFRQWSGLIITKENVAQYADTNLMTALNAFNLFINRDEYLRVWDGSVNPITSDSIYFNYCWLNAGNKIYITPNLQYEHYIAKDKSGHYETYSHLTVDFHADLMNKIKQLK